MHCNGCQGPLRPATDAEILAELRGQPAPDVRLECEPCRSKIVVGMLLTALLVPDSGRLSGAT